MARHRKHLVTVGHLQTLTPTEVEHYRYPTARQLRLTGYVVPIDVQDDAILNADGTWRAPTPEDIARRGY
jgi:hypothetical protein